VWWLIALYVFTDEKWLYQFGVSRVFINHTLSGRLPNNKRLVKAGFDTVVDLTPNEFPQGQATPSQFDQE
jgi:hypothetical protein